MNLRPSLPSRQPLLAIALGLLALLAWLPVLDTLSAGYIDTGLQRSASIFAVARGFSAAISFLQSATFQLPVIGGLSISPGQLLDPLNDMVESFSNIMLFITSVFALQKLLLTMGASKLLPLLLSVAAAVTLYSQHRRGHAPRLLRAVLLVLVMARFALPLAAIGSDLAWQRFMQKDYAASEQSLGAGVRLVESLHPDAAATDEHSLWERTRENVRTASSRPGAQQEGTQHKYATIRAEADHWVDHMIRLIVFFAMQALLIPLLLFWAMARCLALALRQFAPQATR